jgi:hypothetical protein
VVGIHFVSPVTGKNMDQLMTNIKQVVAKQVCTSTANKSDRHMSASWFFNALTTCVTRL